MKKLLLILTFSSFLYSESIEYWHDIFKNLSYQERSALVKTFVRGIPENLSYSLTAIHLKESFGGRYKFNINSKYSIDVGDFMINTKEYMRKRDIRLTSWNVARVMEELGDYETNLLEAKTIFKYCLDEAKGDYKLAYRYYNDWKSGTSRGYAYAEDIVNIVKVLKKYFISPKLIKERNNENKSKKL